jgi:hypothetical protein
MGSTDTEILKDVLIGSLGSNRSVSNAEGTVKRTFQQVAEATLGLASTAGSDYTLPVLRNTNQSILIKEVRILPSAATVTDVNNANYATISLAWTNDNSALPNAAVLANTALATTTTLPTVNTNSPGPGTGNWSAGISIQINQNANVNQNVPAGSMLYFQSTHTGTGLAIPAGTKFQVIWEATGP